MLTLALFARTTAAQGSQRSVVVLRAAPADAEPWPEATQAVIAELLTAGYELLVRSTKLTGLSEIEAELARASGEAGVVGAVSVIRQNERGVALVHARLHGASRIEVDATQGTVAESRLALRVVELLREIEIPAPVRARPPPSPARPEAPRAPEPSHRMQIWLGAGATFASDVSTPMPWVALSGAFTLFEPFGLEGTLGAAVAAGQASTAAGELDLRAQQGALYLMFDPLAEQAFGIALGLGGGAVFIQESARANAGYEARVDSTRVSLAGAKLRAFARTGRASFVLSVEPGLLLPAVSVRAGEREELSVGRPWLGASLGAGVSL